MITLRRIVVPLLSIWLFLWIALSWGGIQDDALIHLRYADFLHRVHFITFDGVHHSYGTSSLFYVALLAFLRFFISGPLLSRDVSTCVHICLFLAAAGLYLRSSRVASLRLQLIALAVLALLVAPTAVRWLDDGMETGIVIGLVCFVAWRVHAALLPTQRPSWSFAIDMALGALLVLVRTELVAVALFATAILYWRETERSGRHSFGDMFLRSPRGSFLLGAAIAIAAIRITMHSFLPDTAIAKSHGIQQFFPSLGAGIKVIAGSLTFGVGTCALWIISAAIVMGQPRARNLATLLANALLPVVLIASALRGQEIQGVRYLIWAPFFSITWNAFELWHVERTGLESPAQSTIAGGALPLFALLALILVVLPIESRMTYRMLSTRAHTMRLFRKDDLVSALHGKLGVAADVGFISYFSQGQICDLAGLVNGRTVAALSKNARAWHCAQQRPTYAFLSSAQTAFYGKAQNLTDWSVCGQYDFGNMREPDRHFLLVQPQDVAAVCRATGRSPAPLSMALTEEGYP